MKSEFRIHNHRLGYLITFLYLNSRSSFRIFNYIFIFLNRIKRKILDTASNTFLFNKKLNYFKETKIII